MAATKKDTSGALPLLYGPLRSRDEIMRGFPAPPDMPWEQLTPEDFEGMQAHYWQTLAHGAVHTNDAFLLAQMQKLVTASLMEGAPLPTTVAEWLIFLVNKAKLPTLAKGRPIDRYANMRLRSDLMALLIEHRHLSIEDALERAALELKKEPKTIRNLFYSPKYRGWRDLILSERDAARVRGPRIPPDL